ncbi:uncharacterized protein LOC107404714 isoform X1 [Ziziphus jujuba]|uniref:Uncharacterized protein LOC107404714 isoform X1 n=1 Tax=Ziziphus jujuba TaxID=326968 RepID=A0A6P3YU01_ZIZJJ|nr:uncharacterized protein LOC107404714 isoform X1 [Ziziphus jujuba]
MNKIPTYPERDYSSRDRNNSDSDSEMVPKIFGNFAIKTKYGALAATATPFVVFGGVYIAWAYLNQAWQRRKDEQRRHRRVLSRSVSIGALHSGNLALQRLIMYHEARANDKTLETAECQLRILLTEETLDFQKLQMVIPKMEMSGKEEQAVDMLEKALTKANGEGKKHEAYEIGMLIVEMLIYKGDLSKAKACDCLNDEHHEVISDARRPLYKAIIHIMVDDEEKIAKESWDEFSNIREDLHCPPTFRESMEEIGIQNLSTNFDEFKKVVKRLKDDIDKHIKKAKEKKGHK